MGPTAMALSGDGKLVATGTSTLTKVSKRNRITNEWQIIKNEDPIRIWDLSSGQLVKELGGLRGTVRSMAFSPNGKYLVSSQSQIGDEHIWIWNLVNGNLIEKLKTSPQTDAPSGCAFSLDGSQLVAAGGRELIVIEFKK
jgi:WD40 repeat protein